MAFKKKGKRSKWEQEVKDRLAEMGSSMPKLARMLDRDLSNLYRWLKGRESAIRRRDVDAALARLAKGDAPPPRRLASARSAPHAAPDAAQRAEALERLRAAVEEVAALCKGDSPGEASGSVADGHHSDSSGSA